MPKNLAVIDIKSQNEAIIDILPKNYQVKDILPKNMRIDPQTLTRSYEMVINSGQPIGLLLTLIYPTTGTVTQW